MLAITERFTIGRQSYDRRTNLQGRTQELKPDIDILQYEEDPESCAQIVVDLACETPGIIFTVFDTISQDHIAVVHDGETREELLQETRYAMTKLSNAGDRIEEQAAQESQG